MILEKVQSKHKGCSLNRNMDKDIYSGKKVFFLYPHHFIQDMIKELVRNGYEAYLIFNQIKVFEILKKYNNSILFINIDEILKESEWEEYIKKIKSTPELKNIHIGIITYLHKNKDIAEKYLIKIGIQCGFIVIETNLKKCRNHIIKVLKANEVKGRRKYIRAICNPKLDTFNIILNNKRYDGKIINISIAGMACIFTNMDFSLENRTSLKNMQLILRGAICLVSGIVAGIRKKKEETIYIILFNLQEMKAEIKEKIHNLIYHCLQDFIEKELNKIDNKKSEIT